MTWNSRDDYIYDEAWGPRGLHKYRRRAHRNLMESMDLLVVEMKIDAEIQAKRNVKSWHQLSNEEKKRREKGHNPDAFSAASSGKSAVKRQEPLVPDPPMPTELPPAPTPGGPIHAKPSGINARYRKAIVTGKIKPKRIKGMPAHWFDPVKEEVVD